MGQDRPRARRLRARQRPDVATDRRRRHRRARAPAGENDEGHDRDRHFQQLQPDDRGAKRLDQSTAAKVSLSHAQAGIDALRRGDARTARESFERIVAAGQADASAYLGLAYACAGLKDRPAALAAVDRALALEPRNLRALVMKGDCLATAGDDRAAASHYRAAVNAAPPPNQLPAELRQEISRAESMCERYAAQFETFLRERLAARGFVEGRSSVRFSDSLDIQTGRKRVYLQEPRQYFFPELPQIQFYARTHFPWLDKLEAATDDIRAELIEILKEDSAFTPYIEFNPRLPQTGNLDMLKPGSAE
ncbi:MAG: tetratricopeptide repeat protein [Betaproteobacteria bacterium]|nr:MAG: tetratricopeptide repeat protein [Betaproteobacteria bacterium]